MLLLVMLVAVPGGYHSLQLRFGNVTSFVSFAGHFSWLLLLRLRRLCTDLDSVEVE